jgi:hypothetical protein
MKSFIVVLMIAFAAIAFAAEVTEIRIFAWDQTELTNVTQWEMEWGLTEDGAFALLGTILYDGTPQTPFRAPLEATVTGPGGTTQTRWFRLRTCGDVPQQDGSTEYLCSTYSNVISSDFWIPAGEFQVPVEFRIIPE